MHLIDFSPFIAAGYVFNINRANLELRDKNDNSVNKSNTQNLFSFLNTSSFLTY